MIIEGYRLGKSITATLKCTPGVGSTTMAPLYFLPLMTAVEVVLPFLVRMSSAFGNEHVSFAVFAVHEVAYPSAYSLAANIFHGHAADSGKYQDEFHGRVVFETGQLVGDF